MVIIREIEEENVNNHQIEDQPMIQPTCYVLVRRSRDSRPRRFRAFIDGFSLRVRNTTFSFQPTKCSFMATHLHSVSWLATNASSTVGYYQFMCFTLFEMGLEFFLSFFDQSCELAQYLVHFYEILLAFSRLSLHDESDNAKNYGKAGEHISIDQNVTEVEDDCDIRMDVNACDNDDASFNVHIGSLECDKNTNSSTVKNSLFNEIKVGTVIVCALECIKIDDHGFSGVHDESGSYDDDNCDDALIDGFDSPTPLAKSQIVNGTEVVTILDDSYEHIDPSVNVIVRRSRRMLENSFFSLAKTCSSSRSASNLASKIFHPSLFIT